MDRMIGKVFREFKDKGYCFVRGEDGLSRFLHVSKFIDPRDFDGVAIGVEVEFEPVEGPKGAQADKAVLR